jgi:hypothetical protein
MRILVLALPRTGSKFVTNSLVSYINDPTYKYEDYFGGVFYPFELYTDGNKAKATSVKIHSPTAFIQNCIDVFKQIEGPLVVKLHYASLVNNPELTKELLAEFDHVIVLHRRDLFGQLLSNVISERTNSWAKNDTQEELKSKESFAINLNTWFKKIDHYKSTLQINFGDAVNVYCEDLFDATNEQFCKLVNLPFRPFTSNLDTIEFGSSKESMVTNAAQLKSILEARMCQ